MAAMTFTIDFDSNVPTHVVNRTQVTVAEGMWMLELALIDPSQVVAWHVAGEAQQGSALKARHVARIVTTPECLANLRQQLEQVFKAMSVQVVQAPTGQSPAKH